MPVKVDIAEERKGLAERVAQLQRLCMDEWLIMSHQLAVQRQHEILTSMQRIRTIDQALARRKRRSK